MTWFEFRSKVDEYLAEKEIDPKEAEVLYLNIPSTDRIEDLEVDIDGLYRMTTG